MMNALRNATVDRPPLLPPLPLLLPPRRCERTPPRSACSSNARSSSSIISRLPPLRVQPALQDLHRGRLIDNRPLTLPADATFGQPTGCHHGRHPLVRQGDRNVPDCTCQSLSVRTNVDGGSPLGPVEAHG